MALSAWLLASPDHLVSRTMTWDLLFNLSGAWHLYDGQVAHVDFHDPVGSLYFWLTYLGFRIGGATVFAFVTGQLIITAVLFAAAIGAAARRLPLLPAVVFVLFTCQLALTPTNVGDLIDDFTFAMTYNAYGWGALSVVSLILFMPPRRAVDAAWIDLAIAGVLIVGLYYLKITYFAVALIEVAVAIVFFGHVSRRRAAWAAVGTLGLANAIAPYNWSYLGDLFAAVESGAIRASKYEAILVLSANATELAQDVAMLLVAVALWRSGKASSRLPLAIGTLIVCGLAILSQNAQLRGLPLATVAAFLLYDHFRTESVAGVQRGLLWVLVALLMFPLAVVAHETMSLASYHRRATNSALYFVVDRTNLRGLAVPSEPETLQRPSSSRVSPNYMWLSRARSIGANLQLSQFRYVQTLLEAAALFEGANQRPGGILVLDQVNPFPFVLGRPPPRGVSLWLDTGLPWQPAQVMFEDANYVLVPKFSTFDDVTNEAIAQYGAYLTQHFPVRLETPSWTLLSRVTPISKR